MGNGTRAEGAQVLCQSWFPELRSSRVIASDPPRRRSNLLRRRDMRLLRHPPRRIPRNDTEKDS